MATTHAVIVVPTLAPIIIPTDSFKVINPALTKLMVMTVVADDDCIRAVEMKPVKKPINRFLATFLKVDLSCCPAALCTPSLMTFMPYMKRASDPKIWTI